MLLLLEDASFNEARVRVAVNLDLCFGDLMLGHEFRCSSSGNGGFVLIRRVGEGHQFADSVKYLHHVLLL